MQNVNKAIFVDIDGTLVNDNGVIPESARHAIQAARNKGNLVFICTGRSIAEIYPDILDVGFDGIIGAAGGYIEHGNEVLLHERIQKEQVQLLVDFFNKHEIDFYLESNGGLFASINCKSHLQLIIDQFIKENPDSEDEIKNGLQPFYDVLIEGEDLVRDDINKISFLGSDIPFDEIKNYFQSHFTVIPSTVPMFGENSGELSLQGIHKATAIEKLIKHLNIDKENTFGYGDGLNDIEMLQFVNHGIAMGNAKRAVMDVADDVTGSPDEDGILNSFKKYHLI